MADLSITTSQIVADSTQLDSGISGEAITAGMAVYKKAADGKIYKAIDTSAAAAAAKGIAVSSVFAANQGVSFQKGGTITLGAAAGVTAGAVYGVTDTAGGISLISERGSGDFITILGVGDASNGLIMPTGGPFAGGVAIP